MISTQNVMNYDEGRGFSLVIDSTALTIELAGTLNNDFKQKYPSLAAMEKDYKIRVAPYLKKHDCYDIDLEDDVQIITDFATYFEELEATGGRGNEDEGDEDDGDEPDLDELVERTVKLLRVQANKALGTAKTRLDVAMFCFDHDMPSMRGVLVNPKGMNSSMSDEELARVIGDDSAPYQREKMRGTAHDMEMNPIGGNALEPYGDDPYSLLDWSNSQLLHFALARLEANPDLRSNVTTTKKCRFLVDEPLWHLVASARTYVGQPAEAFFKATRDAWKRPWTPPKSKSTSKPKPKPKSMRSK